MGSELCTAVETAFSLAYLYQALGVNEYADRAERTIFNALPVMMTEDHWAHQYMAQPNAPWTNNSGSGNIYGPPVFTTANIGVATTYGLEPQYPCCTVNHPQGYPKFLANSWVVVGGNGLQHALLSPSTVIANLKGGRVTVDCDTSYPFTDALVYSVDAAAAFDLYVRVPGWAAPEASSISVNGAAAQVPRPDAVTGALCIPLPAGRSVVVYTVRRGVRTEARAGGAVSVYVGNVLYALDLRPTNISSLPHRSWDAAGPPMADLPFPQLQDYYIAGTREWAVAIDPSSLQYQPPAAAVGRPFAPGSDAGSVSASGCPVDWDLYLRATPHVVPRKPVCRGKNKVYTLVPYGQAKVHMSELPVVNLGFRFGGGEDAQKPVAGAS